MLEIVASDIMDDSWFAVSGIRRGAFYVAMEICDNCRKILNVFQGKLVLLNQDIQLLVKVKLVQANGIVNCRSCSIDGYAGCIQGNRRYVDVKFRREAFIKTQFFEAIELSFLKRRKIQKAQINGFFYLVHDFTREQYPGNMCFYNLHM
jgi:hypothetical protein